MLVLVSSVLGVTAQVDRPSAEPVISEVTVLQLVRKTARGKKGGIEIEGCGIWAESSRARFRNSSTFHAITDTDS